MYVPCADILYLGQHCNPVLVQISHNKYDSQEKGISPLAFIQSTKSRCKKSLFVRCADESTLNPIPLPVVLLKEIV